MTITTYLFDIAPKPTIISIVFYGITEVIPAIIIYLFLLILIGPGTRELLKRIPIIKKYL